MNRSYNIHFSAFPPNQKAILSLVHQRSNLTLYEDATNAQRRSEREGGLLRARTFVFSRIFGRMASLLLTGAISIYLECVSSIFGCPTALQNEESQHFGTQHMCSERKEDFPINCAITSKWKFGREDDWSDLA